MLEVSPIMKACESFQERHGEVRIVGTRPFVGAVSRMTGAPADVLLETYNASIEEYDKSPVAGLVKHAYARACVYAAAMVYTPPKNAFQDVTRLVKHKYLRRIPTGDPKRPWRYVYPEDKSNRTKVIDDTENTASSVNEKAEPAGQEQLSLNFEESTAPGRHPMDRSPSVVGPVHYSMNIKEVESSIRKERLEHLVVFDNETGKQVYRAVGSPTGVTVPKVNRLEWNQHEECVATHNHPSGVSFSSSDLLVAVGADLQEIRAVSPNGGVFVFTRPPQGWGTPEGLTGKQVMAFIQEAEAEADEAARDRMDQLILDVGGNPNHGTKAKGYTKKAWLKILSEESERAFNEAFKKQGLDWKIEHQGTRHLGRDNQESGQGLAQAVPTHFASGSNRTPDIKGFAHDLGYNIGLVADEIREEQFELLENLAGKGVKVFVDSGAFGEVTFPKNGPPIVKKPITHEDWNRRFATYERLARALGDQLTIVAPDRVGSQEVTLERMSRYAEATYENGAMLGARVLVPVQKGEIPMDRFYQMQADALGFDIGVNDQPDPRGLDGYYVPAMPMMKDATTPEQVGEFVAKVRPPEIHLLGMGPSNRKLEETVAAIRNASPDTVITMDSNLLGSKQGRDRKKTSDNPTGARAFTFAQDKIERQMNMLMGPRSFGGIMFDSANSEVSANRSGAMMNAIGAPHLAFSKKELRAIGEKAGLKSKRDGGSGLLEKWVENPERWDSVEFEHFSGRTNAEYRSVLAELENAAYQKFVQPLKNDPGRVRQIKKQAAIREVFADKTKKGYRNLVLSLIKSHHQPPAGYQPVPGSKVGGYRKRKGKEWDYWYPSGTKVENLSLKELFSGAAEHLQTQEEKDVQFSIFDKLWSEAKEPKTVVQSTAADGEPRVYKQHVEHDPNKPWTDPNWTPDFDTYDKILINSSAGKDSQAMLSRIVELADAKGYPRQKLVVVHADLGRVEWDDTKELAKKQADHYGLSFEVVHREEDLLSQVETRFETLTKNAEALAVVSKGAGLKEPTWSELLNIGEDRIRALASSLDETTVSKLWRIVRSKGNSKKSANKIAELSTIPWPSSQARYCTSDHKTSQVSKLVTKMHERFGRDKPFRVLNCLGIRAQESSERAKKSGFHSKKDYETKGSKNKGQRTCDEWFPIFGWSEERVWDTIKDSGVEHHKAYDLGMSRLSCAFCVFAPQHALVTAAKHNPKLFQQYLEVERKVGADFQHGKPLSDIAKVLARAQEREMPEELVQLGCSRVGQGLKKSWGESSVSDFVRVLTVAKVAIEADGQLVTVLDFDWKDGGACVHLNTGDKSHHIVFLDENRAFMGSLLALSAANALGLRFVEHGAPPPMSADEQEDMSFGLSGVLQKALSVKNRGDDGE